MIRTIFLISPVFVSLLWAIALAGNKKNHGYPRTYLAKFMFLLFFCFGAHFLYFVPLQNLYPYFDIPLQIFGNLIFPVFYIYFRLLTVDNKFSLRAHAKYLIIPSIIPLLSVICVFFTPWHEFQIWLFDKTAFIDSSSIQILIVLRTITSIQFLIVIVATFIGSYQLLNKHGAKAEEYYSDLRDGKYNNAKMLSLTIVLSCVASFIAVAVGRYYIMPKDLMIYLIWTIFSVAIYLIGYMGMKQKPVNPTFDLEEKSLQTDESSQSPEEQNITLKKLLDLFNNQKVYLNSQLTIMDVVQEMGSNRTNISTIINQHCGQNFCTFVNNYRLVELERVVRQNPKQSYNILAESCGFGSVNSLKRSVTNKTGLSVSEWKKQVLTT
jgi:AraC-like DNA-binding protein